MSRIPLSALDGREFDVAVIGGGINGAAAAQHAAAAGYRALLVEKGDFASGTSGGSSRILHCGLRYLATGSSLGEIAAHPVRFAAALRMARQAMRARAQFVATTPERVVPRTLCYPVYAGGPYAAWQLRAAFALLARLGPREPALDFRLYRPHDAEARLPFVRWLAKPSRLRAVASYREYQFEWPERIAMDAILDAGRLGARLRNYTELVGLARRPPEGWRLELRDALGAETACASARVVLNAAGIWIDRVNALANARARRLITGTKGVHVMMRLPPECAGYGLTSFDRELWPFYCLPWRELHYFGPTETLYEGDPDDVYATEDEIAGVIDEARRLLPGLAIGRENVIFTWSCVRPLTYDPALLPRGRRAREIHDMARDGLPGLFAITAGPIMTHRSAGEEFVALLRRRIAPSGPAQALSYAPRTLPEPDDSTPLLDHDPEPSLAELRARAETEQVTGLTDLLARRTRAGWSATLAWEAATRAAGAIAPTLGWSEARCAREARSYRDRLAHFNTLADDPREVPPVAPRAP